jgi:hypothetical protein
MNAKGDIPVLERPSFFDGQLLDAADLGAVATHARELRWLHNRSLHGWGVVSGLAVAGERRETAVLVTSGVALDCQGRELLVPHDARLTVPQVPGGPGGTPASWYLTLSYIEDADLPQSETRAGMCGEAGAVRRPERARLRWQSPADIEPATRYRRGLDILLAVIEVVDCRLHSPPAAGMRRELAANVSPYIRSGSTAAQATVWRLFPATGAVLGVETTVDTSSAGFRHAPVYTAHVLGERELEASAIGLPPVLIDGVATVVTPLPTSFVLRVTLPRDVSMPPYVLNPGWRLNPQLPDLLTKQLGWYVTWMGLEP